MTTLLDVRGMTKAYPGVLACDGIAFDIREGEIHALLGENGAGKSTLVKMIYGLVRPDSGEMRLGGTHFAPPEPRAALADGVAMVFQHFSLFEALTVAENIALGMDDPPNAATLVKRIRDVSTSYGLAVDPDRIVGDLSAGERQRVEIVRCLLQSPRILIMDEPTSVLTPQEVALLFRTLKTLAAEGTSILYISHKLEEIRILCDRATILRNGQVVATCIPAGETARSLAAMMVGSGLAVPEKHRAKPGEILLEVSGLSMRSMSPFGTRLKDITFSLRAGEVLGIAGVAGNGQDELLLALSGEERSSPGTIMLASRDVGPLGPSARRYLGLLAAPEQRLGHAAAPDMSLSENALITAAVRRRLVRRGWSGLIDWPATDRYAHEVITAFDVRTPGVTNAAKSLSGGNLQKFVIGREILQDPRVLVVNQPTWGVDAAAAAAIRIALIELAEQGTGVLVISQDLDELMEISDSFSVIAGGRLTAPQPTRGATVEDIGLLMGSTGASDAAA
ncbi:MAG: ABC transporter ATP-binding protein [Paracoccaceae bacterium]|nr:ABC transporter ATP-binding protein [Paracoccaceae bacterium]